MLRTRAGRWGSTFGWCLIASLAVVSVALADALVVVNVRGENGQPAEGTVTLTAEAGGHAYSCQTQNGKCEIPKVPGGNYKASVIPTGATQATPPRTVMIPPAGKVSLIVSTVAAP